MATIIVLMFLCGFVVWGGTKSSLRKKTLRQVSLKGNLRKDHIYALGVCV